MRINDEKIVHTFGTRLEERIIITSQNGCILVAKMIVGGGVFKQRENIALVKSNVQPL
jgi:hypothetical protein